MKDGWTFFLHSGWSDVRGMKALTWEPFPIAFSDCSCYHFDQGLCYIPFNEGTTDLGM